MITRVITPPLTRFRGEERGIGGEGSLSSGIPRCNVECILSVCEQVVNGDSASIHASSGVGLEGRSNGGV